MTVLRTLFPEPAAYGRAMATWGGLSVLGATAGNLLSGVIAGATSWRGTFAVPVAATLAALLLAPRVLPGAVPGTTPARHRAPDRHRTLDLPGALLATAGITLASYGLVLTDAHPWGSAPVLAPLLTGLALLAAFGLVERRSTDPLLPPGFLRDGRRALGTAAIGLTAMRHGLRSSCCSPSPSSSSAAGTSRSPRRPSCPSRSPCSARAGFAGPLIGRYGPGRVTATGLATAAAGLGLLAATGFDTSVPYAYGLLPGLLLLPRPARCPSRAPPSSPPRASRPIGRASRAAS